MRVSEVIIDKLKIDLQIVTFSGRDVAQVAEQSEACNASRNGFVYDSKGRVWR